jgi:chemotaxis signal transduction protein
VGGRLLTFEVGGAIYALPIAAVLEVTELEQICCVPSIPARSGGVVNWHGDALPIVAPSRLLTSDSNEEPAEAEEPAESEESEREASEMLGLLAEQILVVADQQGRSARLGMPIGRVLGLVEGEESRKRGRGLVIERRPVDGRVVNVLDPGRLVARAAEVIEQSAS